MNTLIPITFLYTLGMSPLVQTHLQTSEQKIFIDTLHSSLSSGAKGNKIYREKRNMIQLGQHQEFLTSKSTLKQKIMILLLPKFSKQEGRCRLLILSQDPVRVSLLTPPTFRIGIRSKEVLRSREKPVYFLGTSEQNVPDTETHSDIAQLMVDWTLCKSWDHSQRQILSGLKEKWQCSEFRR